MRNPTELKTGDARRRAQRQSFQWVNGARGFTTLDPDAVGKYLLALRKRLGRPLKPDDVVAAARPMSSPLHPAFNWNIDEAARRHWHDEAARLIRSIKVVVQANHNPPVEVPLFVSYEDSDDPGTRRYDVTSDVVKDNEAWQKVISRIKRDLAAHASLLRSLESIAGTGEAADLLERAIAFLERIVA